MDAEDQTTIMPGVTATAVLSIAVSLLAGCSHEPKPVEVIVALPGPEATVRSATVVIDYSQAAAHPINRGGRIACTSILPGVTSSFSDNGKGRLTADLQAPAGLSVPSDFAVCRMTPEGPGIDGATIAKRLRVRIASATDVSGKKLRAQEQTERPAQRRAQRGGRGPGHRAASAPPAAPVERSTAGAASPATGTANTPSGSSGAILSPERGHPATEQHQAARTQRPGARPPATGAETRPAPPPAGGHTAPPPAAGSSAPAAAANTNDESDRDRSAAAYEITFGVTDQVGSLGALQFTVEFLGSSGGWRGAGGSVDCTTEVPGAIAAYNDTGGGSLNAGMIVQAGMETPTAVATCVFKSRQAITPDLFRVRVTDAAGAGTAPDAGIVPVDPLPAVEVIDVRPTN